MPADENARVPGAEKDRIEAVVAFVLEILWP